MFIMGIVLDYSNVWPDARQSCNEDSLGGHCKESLRLGTCFNRPLYLAWMPFCILRPNLQSLIREGASMDI